MSLFCCRHVLRLAEQRHHVLVTNFRDMIGTSRNANFDHLSANSAQILLGTRQTDSGRTWRATNAGDDHASHERRREEGR
eukprot:747935-Hanusia_phi.AAC.7